MKESIQKRKAEHIELCLTDQVMGENISSGLEKYRFLHHALPDLNFEEIEIGTSFLEKSISTPFLVSSMTGGAALAEAINRNLAVACEERGWAFGLGSTRAMVEDKAFRSSFQIRKYAPTIPVLANLGAVQLNEGFTVDECKRIMDWTEADGLVLHLNSIQEVIQQNGDTNFKDLLTKIEHLAKDLDVPVGAKEVGFGIDGEVAKSLVDAGLSFIDVAGAGGTSWSQVEKLRSKEKIKKIAAEAFSDWGNPTAFCLEDVLKEVPDTPLIASGGMKTGLDAAKSLAIGANLVGFARSILKEAVDSEEAILEWMEVRELELQMVMFGIGAKDINALKSTNRLVR
ncbi:type 2 isopentenyl-diphosphate Delta-isomerase [Saliterribacillus persicus]|nr:type 2 isopentenyl-diphosphate Delta-isomerase [Saliterribacillus persicus]